MRGLSPLAVSAAGLALALVLACDRGSPSGLASPSASLPPIPWKAAAIAHGGAGGQAAWSDGCRAAVDAALKVVEAGGDPVDAAVAGVVVMEDDPRFNAGTGSRVRLDGKSIQMDASVMRSDGRFGAVAGIERTKNPVKVARAVMDSPHLLLQGDGATRFARTLGMADYDPTTPESASKSRTQQTLALLGPDASPEWKRFDWRAHWNFEAPIPAELRAEAAAPSAPGDAPSAQPTDAASAHDTVGVAVRAADGRFGVALSTGGLSLAMRGRVGDVPILGAGLYAGRLGAAAATGAGERIVEAGLTRKVYEWIEAGASAQNAAQRAVDAIRGRGDIGIIVITPEELAAASDRPMPWAARESGSGAWRGP
jgi:isoaspartyl peptidase/L-asparaginase-like protein (Ntn-hydrolase superfamily)